MCPTERRPPRLVETQATPDDLAIQQNPVTGELEKKLCSENAFGHAALTLHRETQWIINNLRATKWVDQFVRTSAALRCIFCGNQMPHPTQKLEDFSNNKISNTQFANILAVANHRLLLDPNNHHAKAVCAARARAKQHRSHPQKGLPATCRAIRTHASPAVTVLKSDHFKAGYAITPVQIDYEYDKVWISATNCDPDLAIAYTTNLPHKYRQYLESNPTMHLPTINGERPKRIAIHTSAPTGGLDSTHPKEISLLHDKLWEWLAALLTMIEDGAECPTAAPQAKPASLRKPITTGECISHDRILTLTRVVYRPLAKYRCSQPGTIFKPWAMDGLTTAGPGQGAADEHYAFAVRLEHAIVLQHPFAGHGLRQKKATHM